MDLGSGARIHGDGSLQGNGAGCECAVTGQLPMKLAHMIHLYFEDLSCHSSGLLNSFVSPESVYAGSQRTMAKSRECGALPRLDIITVLPVWLVWTPGVCLLAHWSHQIQGKACDLCL